MNDERWNHNNADYVVKFNGEKANITRITGKGKAAKRKKKTISIELYNTLKDGSQVAALFD